MRPDAAANSMGFDVAPTAWESDKSRFGVSLYEDKDDDRPQGMCEDYQEVSHLHMGPFSLCNLKWRYHFSLIVSF